MIKYKRLCALEAIFQVPNVLKHSKEGFRLHLATWIAKKHINLANFVRYFTYFNSKEGIKKRRSVQFMKDKVVEIGARNIPFTQHQQTSVTVQTHGLLILLTLLLLKVQNCIQTSANCCFVLIAQTCCFIEVIFVHLYTTVDTL